MPMSLVFSVTIMISIATMFNAATAVMSITMMNITMRSRRSAPKRVGLNSIHVLMMIPRSTCARRAVLTCVACSTASTRTANPLTTPERPKSCWALARVRPMSEESY